VAARALRNLERLKTHVDDGAAEAKLALMRALGQQDLRTAAQVRRLHEVLCFLRAYPGDERVAARAARLLDRFDRRKDLVRHRDALADSGIAGTAIRYRFFWSTALWLARRWPRQLVLERDDAEAAARLGAALPLLAARAGAEWLAEAKAPVFDALDRLRGRSGDAAWLTARIAALPGDGFTREAFADGLDLPWVLEPGRDTPSRSRAHFPGVPHAFRFAPVSGRPDLRAALGTPPTGVRLLRRREAAAMIELARAAMVTRARDLMAFEYAEPRDVRLVDDGDGLGFAFVGVAGERRSILPALFGYLMLRNGVPVGYGQVDVLGPRAAVSFNVFDTFRGAEAALLMARLMSATRHVFGATSFSLEPYQLGQGNDEAIETGAWWFYHKLGFRPLATEARRVMRGETARRRANPRHRSSSRTLRSLARHHLFFDLGPVPGRGLAPAETVLARASAWLARRGGGTLAEDAADDAARRVTGLRSLAGYTRDERIAWRRWAPVIASWPNIARWSTGERRALVGVVRAKGGAPELEYLLRVAAHPRLSKAFG
jgi:hypothetical protein